MNSLNDAAKNSSRAIKDMLQKIQDIAICLNSDSAAGPTNAEMEAAILEHTIEAWRELKRIDALLIIKESGEI